MQDKQQNQRHQATIQTQAQIPLKKTQIIHQDSTSDTTEKTQII
jgi:hypothetical protein